MPFRASSESEDNFVWDRETNINFIRREAFAEKNVPHLCMLSTMVFFAHFDNLIVLEIALLPNLLQNYWDGGYAAMSI